MCPSAVSRRVLRFPASHLGLCDRSLLVEWYARCQQTNNRIGGAPVGHIVAVGPGRPGEDAKANGPEWGHLINGRGCWICRPPIGGCGQGAFLQAETRQVAVAIGDLGARHQEAVDRDHQAGEQRGGGGESDGSGLGHRKSLSRSRRSCCLISKGSLCIPDANIHQFVCIAAFVLPHCGIGRNPLGGEGALTTFRRAKNVML